MSDEVYLRRALAALGPYAREVTIVGAWAHRLFERHPLAQPLGHDVLMTEDADLATPERLAVVGDPIPKRLEDAGFEPRLGGVDSLPVMKFVARDSDGFYVEFIAPLVGSATDRSGEPRRIVEIAGATAQLLRHVELLRFEPWEIVLGDGTLALVANPASYLVQKLLTRREGAGREKLGKDLLYVHDTLQMFGAQLHALRPQGARVLAQLHPKHAAKFRNGIGLAIETQSAVAAEIAASTGRPAPPSSAAIAATCRVGLAAIFGP